MASTIKVTNINTPDGTGNIIVDRPLSGSGASLTNLPAANLTGTLPAISGTNLTNLDATDLVGAVPSASLGNVQGKGADIASSSTMVIGTDGGYFDITGTTGITAMTVAAGRMFTLQFDAAVVLTNSSTLKLSGAANFTTAAGDHLTFVSVAANDVRQVGFGLTDGGSPVAPVGVSAYKGYTSRNQTTASGTQVITGVGFTPKIVYFICVLGGVDQISWGWDTNTDQTCVYDYGYQTENTYSSNGTYAMNARQDASNHQSASITAMGADGFTLTWVKTGSPSSATMEIHYFAIG